MKNIVLVALFIFGFSMINGSAQQKQRMSPKERVKQQMKHLNSELKLTDDQSQKVEGIMLDYMDKQKEIRKPATGDREKMKNLRAEMNKARNKEFKEVLTEKQFEKFVALRKEQAKRYNNREPGS